MMGNVKLTTRSVAAAECGDKDVVLWDSELRGFGLKLTKGGAKVYVAQYRMGGRGAPTRRVTIGRHGSPWTTASARQEAEQLLRQARGGIDPQAARQERNRAAIDLAFNAYVDRFLADYGRREWKPKTFASAASALRRWAAAPIGRKSVADLKRSDLTRVLDRIPAESQALRRSLFAQLSRLFSWAVERGDIEKSPLTGMAKPKAVASRERVLNELELLSILAGSLVIAPPFGEFIRLLLLTGQRRDEVAAMRWEELDRATEEWRIPESRTKNSRKHTVSLSRQSVSELDDRAGGQEWPEQGFVFTTTGRSPISGFSRMKMRLDKEANRYAKGVIPPWRLHDLRRSLATGFQKIGIRFEVTEAVLNHISGSKSGVAGVYQRYDWLPERREALQLWADHLHAMLSKPEEQMSEPNLD